MSNDTPSLFRADAYVTGLPQSEFACRIYTFYRQELEVVEARHGFIPLSGEMVASRVRRRYRLIKGGHPFLVLVHYSRGQSVRQSFLFSFVFPFCSWHPPLFSPFNQLSRQLCRASQFDSTRCASITTSRPSSFWERGKGSACPLQVPLLACHRT